MHRQPKIFLQRLRHLLRVRTGAQQRMWRGTLNHYAGRLSASKRVRDNKTNRAAFL
jgi:hypothetical protein